MLFHKNSEYFKICEFGFINLNDNFFKHETYCELICIQFTFFFKLIIDDSLIITVAQSNDLHMIILFSLCYFFKLNLQKVIKIKLYAKTNNKDMQQKVKRFYLL